MIQALQPPRSDRDRGAQENEDQILLTMRAAGKRPIVIAKELRRTEASVIERTARLKRNGRSVMAVVRSRSD